MYSDTIFKKWTAPPDIEEDHQILGAGGPLGQCSRKLISNPALRDEHQYEKYNFCVLDRPQVLKYIHDIKNENN